MHEESRAELRAAMETDDRPRIESLLQDPQTAASINEPLFAWNQPPLAAARSIETARLLCAHGADVAKVGEWWAPGFFVRSMDPEVGRFLYERGAELSPHAAAGLGLVEPLAEMLARDPATVHAKGGDACTPLHFAGTVEVAALLIDGGARLDARDEDHDSTPAQWLIGDRPEVVRYLYQRGATPDLFVAAALGDGELVEKLVTEDPSRLALRVGRAPFHAIGYENLGGTILQWTLGFNSFAHQYASAHGHEQLFESMFERSDLKTRFLVACVMALRDEALAMIRHDPGLVASLDDEDLELLARYCWETNAHVGAVRLMLDVGFPVAHPENSHGYTPLHNAAWGGYGDLVDLLIERRHPVDLRDPDFGSTPLEWAVHCCVREGRHPEGEYGRVAEALISAGNPWDAVLYPTGNDPLDAVLRPRLRDRLDGLALLGDAEAVSQRLADSPDSADAATLRPALMGAAKGGHVEIVRRLIAAGARPTASGGPYDSTPLHAAVEGGTVEVVRFLLSRGADPMAGNRFGSTPIHHAGALGSSREILDLLLAGLAGDLGEALSAKNRFGHTPLDLALEGGHQEAAQILRERGGVEGSEPPPG